MGFEKRVRVSVCGDKGQQVSAVESSKHPGTKGAIMDNKRCEITVALYGDTSDCSSIPDVIAPPSPQYFVEAYATRDAFDEASGWHYPVILRFEECDILVERVASRMRVRKCLGDARKLIGGVSANVKSCSESPYYSRVEIAGICAGETYISISNSQESGEHISLFLEEHAIIIS